MKTFKNLFPHSQNIAHQEPTTPGSKNHPTTTGHTTSLHNPRKTTQRPTKTCPKNNELLNRKQQNTPKLKKNTEKTEQNYNTTRKDTRLLTIKKELTS